MSFGSALTYVGFRSAFNINRDFPDCVFNVQLEERRLIPLNWIRWGAKLEHSVVKYVVLSWFEVNEYLLDFDFELSELLEYLFRGEEPIYC